MLILIFWHPNTHKYYQSTSNNRVLLKIQGNKYVYETVIGSLVIMSCSLKMLISLHFGKIEINYLIVSDLAKGNEIRTAGQVKKEMSHVTFNSSGRGRNLDYRN